MRNPLMSQNSGPGAGRLSGAMAPALPVAHCSSLGEGAKDAEKWGAAWDLQSTAGHLPFFCPLTQREAVRHLRTEKAPWRWLGTMVRI